MVSCVQMYAGFAYTFEMLVLIANCDQVSQKTRIPCVRACVRTCVCESLFLVSDMYIRFI